MKDELSITVDIDGYSCPVIFSGWRRGLEAAAGKKQRAVIVSNPTVFALHGQSLVRRIMPKTWIVIPLMIGDGERFKNARTVAAIHDHLLDVSLNRSDLVVAFGGGVVGDTAGFAAATFKRGVGLVQVPTTLVAMVDAAVGAKVGINHPRGKNLIGTFYQPKGIVINPDWLGTLPEREMNAGVAELVKTGFLVSKNFLQAALSMPVTYRPADRGKWIVLIEGAVLFKSQIVAHDPYDHGIRRILNFGHTFAHAIEQAEGYRRHLHGEAVLAGMVGALYLSFVAGHLSRKRRDEYLQYLIEPITHLAPLQRPTRAYVAPMQYDKKTAGTVPTFVLLRAIGRPVVAPAPSMADIRKAVEFMKRFVNSGGRI
jgi:3-dehydroquinate synthase